jgi:hypothetical protein
MENLTTLPDDIMQCCRDLKRSTKFLNHQSVFNQLLSCLKKELSPQPREHGTAVLDSLWIELTPQILHRFIEYTLHTIPEDFTLLESLIFSLYRTERPLYQIHAIPVIEHLQHAKFAPISVALAMSPYQPLRKRAVETIFTTPGNFEFIFENILRDRTSEKREWAAKMLTRLNPNNIKLAQYNLSNSDFIERSKAIQILGETKAKKYLSKLEPFLHDPDVAVQKAAIDAIAKIGGRKSVQILRDHLLTTDHEPLRRIIHSYLAQPVKRT